MKRQRYSDVVRKEFMPVASEQKREELIQEILQPKNPWSKGGSHVGPEMFTGPETTYAVPKAQYLSN